jgi:hypothetical protein
MNKIKKKRCVNAPKEVKHLCNELEFNVEILKSSVTAVARKIINSEQDA